MNPALIALLSVFALISCNQSDAPKSSFQSNKQIDSKVSKEQAPTPLVVEKKEPKKKKLVKFKDVVAFKGDKVIEDKVKNQTDLLLAKARKLQFSYELTGRIIRSLSLKDLPAAVKLAAKYNHYPNQMLQVQVGEPAVLLMEKSSYNTTGRFNIMTSKLGVVDTNKGVVNVFIDYPEYKEDKYAIDKAQKEMEVLSTEYFSKYFVQYKDDALAIHNSSLKDIYPSDIAGLIFILRQGDSSGIPFQLAANNKYGFLCHLKNRYSYTYKNWQKAYDKITKALMSHYKFEQDKSRDIISRGYLCANDNGLQNQGKPLTFDQCMCGIYKGSLGENLSKSYYKDYANGMKLAFNDVESKLDDSQIKASIAAGEIKFPEDKVKFQIDNVAWVESKFQIGEYEKRQSVCEEKGMEYSPTYMQKVGYRFRGRQVCVKKWEHKLSEEQIAFYESKHKELKVKVTQKLPPKMLNEVKGMLRDWDATMAQDVRKQVALACPETTELEDVRAVKDKQYTFKVWCISKEDIKPNRSCASGEYVFGDNICREYVCPGRSLNYGSYTKKKINEYYSTGRDICFQCPEGSEFDLEQTKDFASPHFNKNTNGVLCRIKASQIDKNLNSQKVVKVKRFERLYRATSKKYLGKFLKKQKNYEEELYIQYNVQRKGQEQWMKTYAAIKEIDKAKAKKYFFKVQTRYNRYSNYSQKIDKKYVTQLKLKWNEISAKAKDIDLSVAMKENNKTLDLYNFDRNHYGFIIGEKVFRDPYYDSYKEFAKDMNPLFKKAKPSRGIASE